MQTTFQVLISGLTNGAIYALIALSYNVVYSASGVLNFAQGAFLMSGTMVGASLIDHHWPIALALLVAVGLGAGLGAVEELFAVRPATSRGGHAIGWVVATLGFTIVLQSAFSLIMGPSARAFPTLVDDAPRHIGGVVFNLQEVLVIAVALSAGLALDLFFRYTRTGWAFTAVAYDREAAAMRGVPVSALATAAFALGGGIAALAGFISGPLIGAAPTIGFGYALSGFVAAAVGGIPDLRGAVVGGLFLGVVQAVGIQQIGPGYRNAVVFGVLVLVLIVRPRGLFGHAAVRAV